MRRSYLRLCGAGLVALCALNWACERPEQRAAKRAAAAEIALGARIGRAHEAWLNGDAAAARRSMEELVSDVEADRQISEWAKAQTLYMTHARLHYLASATGDAAEAAMQFDRAAHWHTITRRSEGSTTASAITPEKIRKLVEALDKGASDGVGPKFVAATRPVR